MTNPGMVKVGLIRFQGTEEMKNSLIVMKASRVRHRPMNLTYDRPRDVDEDTDESIGLTGMIDHTPWQYSLNFASNYVGCMTFNV